LHLVWLYVIREIGKTYYLYLKGEKEMMKKLSLLLVTFGVCAALSACGNNNDTISDSEAATENDYLTEGTEVAQEVTKVGIGQSIELILKWLSRA
jgi:hypothetical protein